MIKNVQKLIIMITIIQKESQIGCLHSLRDSYMYNAGNNDVNKCNFNNSNLVNNCSLENKN